MFLAHISTLLQNFSNIQLKFNRTAYYNQVFKFFNHLDFSSICLNIIEIEKLTYL